MDERTEQGRRFLMGYRDDDTTEFVSDQEKKLPQPPLCKAPMGGELRVQLGWKGLEFENNLYVGENLMPFFVRYGSELYAGERWYGTRDHIYNRTRLGYERSFVDDTIRVTAGMIFHTDGTGLYTQQVVQVSVRLGKTLYDEKNHRRK